MTLRELKEVLNRVPEQALDMPFYVEGDPASAELKAPYAFLGNDDGNAPLTLCSMGTMSCGPIRLEDKK